MLSVRPISLDEANAFVAKTHRDNKVSQGHKFSLGCYCGTRLCAVVIAGEKRARQLKYQGPIMEIYRVAVLPVDEDPAARNAPSFLMGAVVRCARYLGYQHVITYTHASQPGSSLRGAGFVEDGQTKAESWDREGRRRTDKARIEKRTRWRRDVSSLVKKESLGMVLRSISIKKARALIKKMGGECAGTYRKGVVCVQVKDIKTGKAIGAACGIGDTASRSFDVLCAVGSGEQSGCAASFAQNSLLRFAQQAGYEAPKSSSRLSGFTPNPKRLNPLRILLHREIREMGDRIVEMTRNWATEMKRPDVDHAIAIFARMKRGDIVSTADIERIDMEFWRRLVFGRQKALAGEVADAVLDILSQTLALRSSLSNLSLPIAQIKEEISLQEEAERPAWVYLYHIERISRYTGRLVRYPVSVREDPLTAMSLLLEATAYLEPGTRRDHLPVDIEHREKSA